MYSPSDFVLDWHTIASLTPGPRLIITGGVHGIELCGTKAIWRFQAELAAGQHQLACGQLTLLAQCNPMAARLGRREGEGDLNRQLRLHDDPRSYEAHLANLLCPLLLQHEVILDLHSFQSEGPPFAVIGAGEPFLGAADEIRMAKHLGVSHAVEGAAISTPVPLLADTGASTVNFMRANGRFGVTLECGQHQDPQSEVRAYQAILHCLAHFGLLERAVAKTPTMTSVRFAETILRRAKEDRFVKPWQSFDAVAAGELVAVFADGEALHAPRDGYVLFPDPLAKVGTEWVYFADGGSRFHGS